MTQADLNNVRWKTECCRQGESCWCRVITTEEPVFENENQLYIAASGTVPRENAEHIVAIHNEYLAK